MKAERGNILFLILLAVVLFAALSYAVIHSTRGGGNNASKEKVASQTANLLQFFSQVDAAVLRMTLTGGIPIENVSFGLPLKRVDGSVNLNGYGNVNCGTDACKVFSPSGGGATYRTFEDAASPYATPLSTDPIIGAPDFIMMRWPYAKTDLNDIIMRFSYLAPEICQELSRTLNIPLNYTTTGPYLGISVPADWDSTLRYINDPAPYAGKDTGIQGGGTTCAVMHMVYAR